MKNWAHWKKARSGTVALEFGMIAGAFFALLLGVIELAFILYAQTALDYAAKEASREMQTEQLSPTDPTTFKSAAFCPFLSGFLNCASVSINLIPVTDFQTAIQAGGTAAYHAGQPGDGSLMLLQATYTTGLPIWPLNVMTLVGTAAYRNE